MIICTAIVVVESATIYPNYLAYFNAFPGGPTQGPRYLLDSNIDWGQDTKRLKAFLQARGIRGACTAYFGLAYPFYYGIVQLPWPGYVNPSNERSLNCLVAVSATWLSAVQQLLALLGDGCVAKLPMLASDTQSTFTTSGKVCPQRS
jgi:hypothetical protein